MDTGTPRRRSPGMRFLALGCTLLLSCTTVRTHVSSLPADVVIEDGRAEPQIDLWIESNRPLTPEQERDYRAQARAALEAALAGRGQPEGDAVLVVRSQGISRTEGRRGDQRAAKVGLIVGAVAVVTIVILAVIAEGGDTGHASRIRPSPGVAPRAPAAPRPGLAQPRFAPPGPVVSAPWRPFRAPFVGAPRVPTARPPVPLPRPPSYPAPGFGPHGHGGAEIAIGLDLWWWWPVPVEPEPPLYVSAPPPEEAAPGAGPEAAAPGAGPEAAAPGPAAPAPGDGAASPDAAPPEQHATRVVIPAEPFTLDERGFFDGDRLSLEALLLDRKTGAVLWTKRVSRKADPRDPGAVRAAMDELLKEGGWQPPAT